MNEANPPIAHLPPELLVSIFASLADESSVYETDWTVVTHVCRAWRHIALDHPILWRHVNFTDDDAWTRELCLRSQSVSISVLWNVEEAPYSPIKADILLAHLVHTEQLTLLVDDDSHHITTTLTFPAPALHTFSVFSSGQSEVDIPTNLFDSYSPKLHQVAIDRCSRFPWSSPVLNNVVVFNLSNVVDFPLGEDGGFLAALERMSVLKTLSISSVEPYSFVTGNTPSHQHAELSHVSRLTLSCDVTDCVAFFQRVRLSPAVSLDLSAVSTSSSDSIRTLLRAIKSAGVNTDEHAVSLELTSSCPGFVCVQTYNVERPTEQDKEFPAFYIAFLWSEERELDALDVTKAICATFSLAHLQALNVNIRGPQWCAALPLWMDLFGASRSISTLTVSGREGALVCAALTQAYDDGTKKWGPVVHGTVATYFLPTLTNLEIDRDALSFTLLGESAPLHQLLPQWLKQREDAGLVALRALTLDGYGGVTPEWIADLKIAFPSLAITVY
ncbi:hypothetical protein BV25DRAFT_1915736 [Artomyces pyxidatus]|uniref:Uncharacterized protein n=1 Tax=Artomyces pyxidatus TaxID=48021 RepID=A0ACB8T2R0_9AGAM|nr:hypothetical protein BV25DRAFT_1915736 [Artomyces pyxidatus]